MKISADSARRRRRPLDAVLALLLFLLAAYALQVAAVARSGARRGTTAGRGEDDCCNAHCRSGYRGAAALLTSCEGHSTIPSERRTDS